METAPSAPQPTHRWAHPAEAGPEGPEADPRQQGAGPWTEPPVEPWRPGPLGLDEAVERLCLLERFRASLDAEAVGLRVQVLMAYRAREAEGIRELARCTRARGEHTAARDMVARAAQLSGADLEAAHSLAATEIAAALHLADGTARALLEEAEELALHHRPALAALAEGEVSYAHARIINDECRALRLRIPGRRKRETPEQTRAREHLEAEMLAASRHLETTLLAFGTGRTPAQLRDKARRLRETRNPRTAQARHDAAAAARDAWVEPAKDGMGRVCVSLPALQAQALLDRVQRISATRAADPAETRTLAQLRADTLADLALAGTCGNAWDTIHGHVLVLLPHTALTGTCGDGAPGPDGAPELGGYGPIDPASARRLAASTATWTRLYTAPDGLAAIAMDNGRYRPTPAQRRALWAADQTCRFPGCRRNALACEPDHAHEHHHGGPTTLDNLASLCRKHHTYKTLGLWQARIGPGRTLDFTSPAGRTYRTEPPVRWHNTATPPPAQATAPTHAPGTHTGRNRTARHDRWDTPATPNPHDEDPPF